MKKKFIKIIGLFVAVVLLAGCTMRAQTGFKIASSGKIQLQMIYAYDNEMIDAMLTYQEDQNAQEIKTHTDAERWAYIESSAEQDNQDLDEFQKEKYEKDGFKGYRYYQDLGEIDSVTSASAASKVDISSSNNFEGQALFIKNGDTYKSNMTIAQAADSDYSQYESMGAVFEMSFVVELPSKAISSNATNTSSDGKTLSWDLTKPGDIDFEFKLTGGNGPTGSIDDDDEKDTDDSDKDDKKDSKKESKKDDDDDEENSKLWLYVGIGGGALLLIIIIIIIAVASSKKKKAQNAQAAAEQSQTVMAPSFEQPAEPPVQPITPAQPTEEQPVDQNQQQ